MKTERRRAAYDRELRVEAYRLEGTVQPFPNHFHEYYVIGLVEAGARTLICKNQEYAVKKGDVLLFNPGDSHACAPQDGGPLDYWGLNLSREVLLDWTEEATGRREPLGFSRAVIPGGEIAGCLRSLHALVMDGSQEFRREEYLLRLVSLLTRERGRPPQGRDPACREEIEKACAFMEQRYAQRVRLDEIARHAGTSKSTLLRAFPKAKGVTPYGYLENIRVGKARKLLERGVPTAEAALRTGFSDQSHFTRCFSRFIGLSPGAYRELFKNP